MKRPCSYPAKYLVNPACFPSSRGVPSSGTFPGSPCILMWHLPVGEQELRVTLGFLGVRYFRKPPDHDPVFNVQMSDVGFPPVLDYLAYLVDP